MNFVKNLLPLTATLTLVFGTPAGATEQVIRIGHVGPTSGGIAHLGKDSENGARLAIEGLNAKGVFIGGKKVHFELQAEDDGADPKQATAIAQKLVDARVNGVVGHFNSGTTIPASKIYADAGIPQISPAATNPKYTQQGFKTTFRVAANDSQLGNALARYAVQKEQARNIAAIDDRTAYGQGIADEFVKSAKMLPGTNFVARQYTHDKATDFNAILTPVKAKHPDAIFYGGMDAVAGPLLRQMNQLGIKAKLIGGGGICNDALVNLAGGSIAANQVLCALPGGVDEGQTKGLDTFNAAYRKRFNKEVLWVAAYSYDAVLTLAEAMKKAGSPEPDRYLPELARIRYKGITGLIAFSEGGDLQNAAATLYTYNGTERQKLAVTR